MLVLPMMFGICTHLLIHIVYKSKVQALIKSQELYLRLIGILHVALVIIFDVMPFFCNPLVFVTHLYFLNSFSYPASTEGNLS